MAAFVLLVRADAHGCCYVYSIDDGGRILEWLIYSQQQMANQSFIIIMENKYAPKVVFRGLVPHRQFEQDLQKISTLDEKVKTDVRNLK